MTEFIDQFRVQLLQHTTNLSAQKRESVLQPLKNLIVVCETICASLDEQCNTSADKNNADDQSKFICDKPTKSFKQKGFGPARSYFILRFVNYMNGNPVSKELVNTQILRFFNVEQPSKSDFTSTSNKLDTFKKEKLISWKNSEKAGIKITDEGRDKLNTLGGEIETVVPGMVRNIDRYIETIG